MVNDFLKKYQEELISEKIQLKEDIDLLETKIKEESKFLSLLEDSNESYFKEFTPRDINAKNNKKAEEVRVTLNELTSQMDIKLQKMKFFESRLTELNALISNTVIHNKPVIKKNDSEIINDNPLKLDKNQLIDSLKSINDLILLDPYRAQIELNNLISSI
ncbi:two-component system, NarL family, sensor histidine kinase DegS [Pseudobutyrivibrio sp. YE44]|uniref:hypothetical protein n=1 Tax=Pseudobutyrivibrio sp. YE44 TaxID=1520802 RepID=UPI00088E3DC1|nr:hypothetical protein [Pseudobutyrivibrio sp. YE44]SDB52412.1 two-component system, NarL family, sensor histidine kinase DegS [Pseudobutyrivibrio sp. YE44]